MTKYMAAGAFAPLTASTFENSSTWLKSLKDAGTYNGKLYGVPYYAGARAVIYRSDYFKKAGVTKVPTSLAEYVADGKKVMTAFQSDKQFSALYFPGKYWYAALSFVYDYGGKIATTSKGKLDLSSAGFPAARAGTGVAGPAPVRRRALRVRLVRGAAPYLLLTPALVVIAAVLAYPLYLVRGVVPDQRVRLRRRDRPRDGDDHVRRHTRLDQTDGEDGGDSMSTADPVFRVPKRRRGRRRIARRVAINVTGLAVFLVMVFPVYWMVATAFKPPHDVLLYSPKWIPSPATLANFSEAIHRDYFWDVVRNSLIVTGVVVTLAVVCAFLAALALANFRFYGRTAFIVLIMGVLMLPLNALIIPLYILLARTGQIDKLSGVIVTYLTFVLPFTVWCLRGFMMGVPRELEEAAMVDGSSRFGAFVRILLPLIAPGLVATSTFAFIQAWNE